MKTNTSFKLLTLALALGLGATARADSTLLPSEQPAALPADSQGLLGQVYGTLTYSYINLDNTSTHLDSYDFEINQPLSFGLDGFIGYNYAHGSGLRSNTIDTGLRAFSTHYNWGKPYVEAGAGYTWVRASGAKDNSFVWEAAAGVEFQVAPRATVTPFVQYTDAPDLAGGSKTNFGAKANYWIDAQWSVTAGLARDDSYNTAFTVGTHFRF